MMGTSTAALISWTHRSAIGFSAAPEMPPVVLARIGAPDSASTSMPGIVLMAVIPSAPASATARAIAAMSGTFGESFTMQGIDVAAFTARVTAAAVSAEEANISP